MKPKLLTSPDWIPKGWGGEKIIDNRREYCGKILYIMKDKMMSLHYHKAKTETFHVLKGKVFIEYVQSDVALDQVCRYGNEGMISCMFSATLDVGETFFVPKGLAHRLTALEDSEVLEVSTTDDDSDSFRIIKGD